MEVIVAYLSVSVGIGLAIKLLSRPDLETPTLSPRALPSPLNNMSAELVDSSSPSTENPHLELFQSMGRLLRSDPTAVIAQLSAWLSAENSPQFWAPFGMSIRGFAYEVMDEWELARMDYTESLRLYKALEEKVGEEIAKRMEGNVNFIRIRLRTLPPPKSVLRKDPGEGTSAISTGTESTHSSSQSTL